MCRLDITSPVRGCACEIKAKIWDKNYKKNDDKLVTVTITPKTIVILTMRTIITVMATAARTSMLKTFRERALSLPSSIFFSSCLLFTLFFLSLFRFQYIGYTESQVGRSRVPWEDAYTVFHTHWRVEGSCIGPDKGQVVRPRVQSRSGDRCVILWLYVCCILSPSLPLITILQTHYYISPSSFSSLLSL